MTKTSSLVKNKMSKSKKLIIQAVLLGAVVIGLPLAMWVMKSSTNLAPKASSSAEASYLTMIAPQPIEVGHTVPVSVVLNNDQDTAHIVTGVDAIIKYDPAVLTATEVKNGKVFTSLNRKEIKQEQGMIEISGSFSKVKDEAGNPQGYNGSGDPVATVYFKANKVGESKLSFVYNGGQDTSDSNIIAFKRGEPVAGQMPVERFLKAPQPLTVEVVDKIAVIKPSPSPSGSGKCGPCSLTRVLKIDEKNAGCQDGLVCKRQTKVSENCHTLENGKRVCTAVSGRAEYGVCVPEGENANFCAPQPSTSPKPVTLASHCQSCNNSLPPETPGSRCMAGLTCKNEKPKCFVGSDGKKVCNMIAGGSGLCVYPKEMTDVCSVQSSPTSSPVVRPTAQLQLQVSLLDRIAANFKTAGTLYGLSTSIPVAIGGLDNVKYAPHTPRKFPNLVKIADFTTDATGRAMVNIPRQYEGQKMKLFVRTASHLMAASDIASVSLPAIPKCYPICKIGLKKQNVIFSNLVPGDLYIAAGKTEQDNVINTFDAITLIKDLGLKLSPADLNADGVVNVRDLKILSKHLGEKGDSGQISVEPTSVLFDRHSCKIHADCQAGYYCYQPPIPNCLPGQGCTDYVPASYCKKAGEGI